MDKKKKSHPNYRNPTYNYKSLSKTKTNSQSKNANHVSRYYDSPKSNELDRDACSIGALPSL